MLTGMAAAAAGHACSRSASLYRRGRGVFPGGVTRSTVEKDPHPFYVACGEGAHLVDVDGNRLLDLNNNFTTLIHGHGFAPVADAVARLLRSGTCFSNPTHHEIALAELLVGRIPAIEQVRFVNSGTEAVMFAIKAARAYTGRPAIARFEGAFHGAYDMSEAGQRSANGGPPASPFPDRTAETAGTAGNVIVLDFNDADGLEETLAPHSHRLAAILIDPMPSRAGLLRPKPQFIERLNVFAQTHGILIIADEVLNLRQGYAGASSRYGIDADLMTLGKIIGGGFPIGAVGGRAKIMSVFGSDEKAPLVHQGGTFSANPISMVAGRVAMEATTMAALGRLEELGEALREQLSDIALRYAAPYSVTGAASLFRIHPKRPLPDTYRATIMSQEQTERMRNLSRFFRQHGILLPLGAAASLSTPMTTQDADRVCATFERFLATGSRGHLEDPS
jgi:glutamate-1-semialdehyde 2,1-aminomutase